MINLPNKFEVPNFTLYGDMRGDAKGRKWGGYGSRRSLAMSPFDEVHAYDFLFVSNRKYASILYHFRDTASYLLKFTNFSLPHLHLVPPLWVTQFKFRKDHWHQKTRVPELMFGVVCVILCLAILIQYWDVTDTDTRPQLILRQHSVVQ